MPADGWEREIKVPLGQEGLPPGWGPWTLPADWRFEKGAGPGGTDALRLERTDPGAYTLARLPFRLPPESRCRLRASIRIVETTRGLVAALGGVEFFDAENRYLGGGNLAGVCVTGEWVTGEAEFTVPRHTAECRLQFYIRPDAAGTVLFAEPVIGPASFRWTAWPLRPVRDELPAEGGEVWFGFFSQGRLEEEHGIPLRIRAEWEGVSGAVAAAEGDIETGDRVRLVFPPLTPGPARLRYTLLDRSGAVVGVRTAEVRVADAETVRARAAVGCAVDVRGRVTVRRKPFFPLGLYMGYVQVDELKDIQNSPFNCLIPYGSCAMKLDGSAQTGVEAAREVMDACEAHGIKVIFSLAGAYDEVGAPPCEAFGVKTGPEVARVCVTAFRDHPALLAWYLNDEQPLECLPRLLERRRQIRDRDPAHPIYAVMCQIPEFPFYSEITDIYGLDPYPIVDPAMNHIRLAQYAHEMALKAVGTPDGAPLWTVVQAHNIGAYDRQAMKDPAFYRAHYRDPSGDEILALALLAVIHGARGLIFYSYPDLATPAFDAAARPKRWENAKRAAGTVESVRDFLLSDWAPETLPVQVLEGEVAARLFRDDSGRRCVMVVAIGPGPCRVRFRAEGRTMGSRFGHIRPEGDNGWRFEARDVAADLIVFDHPPSAAPVGSKE